MKKKLTAVALVVCMLAIMLVGASLAYFTDETEEAKNVFTVGDVKIKLIEEFDEENAVLMPGTKETNAINKDVTVENTGKSDAWVRVIISVPAKLDVLATEPENYEEIAAQNILHWNTTKGVEEIWNVQKANWEAVLSVDKQYNEYTFYYNEPLKAGKTTEKLLDQVYLDSKVDCEITEDANGNKTYIWTMGGETIDYALENGATIKVKAEAIQAAGFVETTDDAGNVTSAMENAWQAFDAQVSAE